MARIVKGSEGLPATHALIREQYMNHSVAFTSEAGAHLPTPEGWEAELA